MAEPAEPTGSDFRADRIGSALCGQNPTVLARMPGGFAVMGDVQWLPGYCVLLTDRPDVERLSDLPRPQRAEFLSSQDDHVAEAAGHAGQASFIRGVLERRGGRATPAS